MPRRDAHADPPVRAGVKPAFRLEVVAARTRMSTSRHVVVGSTCVKSQKPGNGSNHLNRGRRDAGIRLALVSRVTTTDLLLAPNPVRSREYYQDVHERNMAYQTNNWLLDELDQLEGFAASSVIELACGNGRFLERAASQFARVYGCDWAISPLLAPVLAAHPNVSFFRTDLYQELPPCHAGLVVSADFLEHIAPDAIDDVLGRIDSLAPAAFHKIACYDDGHSHLTILPPQAWLERLRAIDVDYRLERVDDRYGDPNRKVAVLTKGRLTQNEAA